MNVRIDPDGMRIIAETINPRHIDSLIDIITEKYERYPGMRAFVARGSIITSNDGGTRSVNLDISGPDLVADLRRGRNYHRAQRCSVPASVHPVDSVARATAGGSATELGSHGRTRFECGHRRYRRRTDRRCLYR